MWPVVCVRFTETVRNWAPALSTDQLTIILQLYATFIVLLQRLYTTKAYFIANQALYNHA